VSAATSNDQELPDTAANNTWTWEWIYQTETIKPGINFPFHLPESMFFTLPKKKNPYGKDTKHINKVLKKMGRK